MQRVSACLAFFIILCYSYYSIHYIDKLNLRDIMISANFLTPSEVAMIIAKRAKEKRLEQNMSQFSLSERSGVSLGVLKFERTGKISLESLLRLALALDCLADFRDLFKPHPPEAAHTLDELLQQKTRKRGRG